MFSEITIMSEFIQNMYDFVFRFYIAIGRYYLKKMFFLKSQAFH